MGLDVNGLLSLARLVGWLFCLAFHNKSEIFSCQILFEGGVWVFGGNDF